MDECEFVIYLDPKTRRNRYRHYRAWQGKQILEFRLQYEGLMGSEWVAILRYDAVDGHRHRDILYPKQAETQEWSNEYTHTDVLVIGQRDIMENWPIYRQRFEAEMKNG